MSEFSAETLRALLAEAMREDFALSPKWREPEPWVNQEKYTKQGDRYLEFTASYEKRPYTPELSRVTSMRPELGAGYIEDHMLPETRPKIQLSYRMRELLGDEFYDKMNTWLLDRFGSEEVKYQPLKPYPYTMQMKPLFNHNVGAYE